MQGTHGSAVGSSSSSSTSPAEKPLQRANKQQLKKAAVLYIRAQVDVDTPEDKPVTVVFRQAAFVQQPEEPGDSN